MPRILFCGGNENAVDHWHPDPGAYGLDGRDYTLIPAPVSIQRELDRAKPLRKPKESLLCVFATLRETGFPWLLKESAGKDSGRILVKIEGHKNGCSVHDHATQRDSTRR